MFKRVIYSLICIILFGLNLSAQHNLDTNSEDFGDRLKMGFVWQGEVSFNPFLLNYDYDKELIELVFGQGLYTKSNSGQLVKNLILSDSIFSKESLLRFELLPELNFHNGTLITAEDVMLTFELYKKFALQSPRHFNARLIKSIEIYGSDIIRIKLEKLMPDFLETIGTLPIFPKSICKKWLKSNSINDLSYPTPSGFGKFRFVDYQPNLKIKLDSYYSHVFGPSFLSGIDILFFENQELLLESFLREEIDIIRIQDKSEIQKILQFSKKIIQLNKKEKSVFYINLNTRRFPFNDFAIRRALNYAINKNQIMNYLISSNGKEPFVDINPIYSNESRYFTLYDYKPLESLQILFRNRFKKNSQGKLVRNSEELKFELLIPEGSVFDESIARIIAINLGDLGINVIPISMEENELNKRILQGEYQAALRKFYFDPKLTNETLRDFYFKELNGRGSFKNFNNISIEIVLDYAKSASNDSTMSVALRRFQNQMFRYSPSVFLFFKNSDFYAINDRFENVISTSSDSLGNDLSYFKPKYEWFVKKENHKY